MKYKLGMMVEVSGKGFTQINAIIKTPEGTSYRGDEGEFTESEILAAFRPVATRERKKKVTKKQEARVN